jgi:hypothetical protein
VFYDCAKVAVICGDFSKGLGATIQLKAVQDQRARDEPEREFPELQSVTKIDGDTIIVEVAVRVHSETTFL